VALACWASDSEQTARAALVDGVRRSKDGQGNIHEFHASTAPPDLCGLDWRCPHDGRAVRADRVWRAVSGGRADFRRRPDRAGAIRHLASASALRRGLDANRRTKRLAAI